MKRITANSVGTNWRADVFNAIRYDNVEVIDLDGNHLGFVSLRKDSIGRESFYLNGQRTTYTHIWNKMHDWSDVIAAQNTRNYHAQENQS